MRSYRASIASRGTQAAMSKTVPRITVDFDLCDYYAIPTNPILPFYLSPEEEIAYGKVVSIYCCFLFLYIFIYFYIFLYIFILYLFF